MARATGSRLEDGLILAVNTVLLLAALALLIMALMGSPSSAGARVYPAEHADEVQAGRHALPDAVTVVILTQAAASVLQAERTASSAPLTVVMPP